MQNRFCLIFGLLCLIPSLSFAQDKLYSNEFPLGDVQLLESPLKHAQDLNVNVLLQYDCDRLLAPYRKEAGLTPRKPSYPNWDGLDGHVGGHYLSAMAMNAARGNEECRQRMEYMISELQECADANIKNNPSWGVNYIGGFPHSSELWSDFKDGNFAKYKAAWAPFYNLHKMYAGLRDAWLYCGNEQAKKMFLQFCDWAIAITSKLSDAQMEDMLGNEHGGMDEVFADAYAITKDQKYLDCAKRFAHKFLLKPMSEHRDILDNLHANTQIPKVIGFERISQLSNDSTYHNASLYFWDLVTKDRTLAFGGNSRREHFPTKETCIDYVQNVDGPESCNTYNMLKLTEDLFRTDPNSQFSDFYELATFNHILSSQHPEHGGYVYFTPARPRHYRNYSVPNEAMWCCVGTGMENHGKYAQFIYTKNAKAGVEKLYVNLYTASELNWKEKNITLRQETQFPYSESSKITVTNGSGRFMMMLRNPSWCSNFSISVNGKPVDISRSEEGYVSINRKWKKGDVVEVKFPMHASIVHMPNLPQYIAIMYGPVLLGMKTGTEDLLNLLADDTRFGQYAAGEQLPIDKAPFLIAKNVDEIAKDLVPVNGKPLHFKLTTRMENAIEGELQPFFEIHDSRYMMYWLALSEDGYKDYIANLAKSEAVRQALEARTVDKVQPGEQQPETDHAMKTDVSETGVTDGIFYRDARNGHYFSYKLYTGGNENLKLRLKFWGQDDWKTSEFDVYVDDTLAMSINNSHKWLICEFKTEEYQLPAELLKGKQNVTIKFVAKPGKQIGQIYDVRLVK